MHYFMHHFFASAKLHNFDSLSNMNVNSLKLKPTIGHPGTYYCKKGKFVSECFKSLTKNEFVIIQYIEYYLFICYTICYYTRFFISVEGALKLYFMHYLYVAVL